MGSIMMFPKVEVEKIKVTYAEIVVHGTKEKPYFEIKYIDENYPDVIKIGFSSYNLETVFGYLENYFEPAGVIK